MAKVKIINVIRLDEQPADWVGDDFQPGWWLHDLNNTSCPYMGPYDTKTGEDIREDKQRMQTFWREHPEYLDGAEPKKRRAKTRA